ncbi:MAG: hypothetical protein HY553_15065 [Elusimicrobia bacterium]|nr:hypothetical protein [Elusimicrobiota bacterium]
MAEAFSRQMRRLRLDAGFKTAYRFYHQNGGRRNFPFTYVHYLRLENAGRLPRPQWMAVLLGALRLSPGHKGARELCLAYLKDSLESPEAVALILEPLLHPPAAPAQNAAAEAMRWIKAEHVVHLSAEQFRVLAADEATYWCSEALVNDRGSWSPPELAERLGLKPESVRRGLARLASCGIARRTAAGRWACREAGKIYTFPGRLQGMGAALKRVQGFWERMHRCKGRGIAERVELVRAEEGFIRAYWPVLAEALDGANVGAAHTHGENTGLFLIETRVRKLMPF